MKTLLAVLCTLFALAAHAAAEVAGVTFDDTAQVGERTLTLNGAGLRTKFFFKVYAAGLYLPQKADTTDAVLVHPGPKRIDIETLRDLSAEQFTDALKEGLEKNLSAEALAALRPEIAQFVGNLLAVQSVKEGTRIFIDYVPGAGTALTVSGQAAGEPVPGTTFFNALLRVWIGDKPAQDDLKQSLLGR